MFRRRVALPGLRRNFGGSMRRNIAGGAIVAALISMTVLCAAEQAAAQSVVIDSDDIGGVVRGERARARRVGNRGDARLPVRYVKIVVTDDQGRYVVPDLPKANYDVWVRGYGLVDSAEGGAEPGKQLNFTAVAAPNEAEARQILSGHLLVLDDEIPAADSSGARMRRRTEDH